MVSGGGKRAKDRRGSSSAYPASRLLVWHSSFDHPRSRHASLVQGQCLTQQLEVVLPTKSAVDLAGSLQWETSFYYELTAPLALLLAPRFLRDYVLNGSFYMVAKQLASDAQNTAMVLPSGELLLLIDADTYAQLGLVGHKYARQLPTDTRPAKPHINARRAQRYVVSVDLTNAAFLGDEPHAYRDRVVHCLTTKFEPMEMLVASYNARGAPQTLHFEDDTIARTRVEVNGAVEQLHEIFVPSLHAFYTEKTTTNPPPQATMAMEVMRTSLEGVYDWLGVVATRLTELLQQKPREEYVSTFDGVPTGGVPMEPNSEISVVTWRGLIGSAFTQRVLDRVRDEVAKKTIPWASVSVWGFADSIVSWQQEYEQPLARAQQRKLAKQQHHDARENVPTVSKEVVAREHGYLLNGNNNSTFVVLPQHEYFVLQEVGPHDATM